MSPTPSSLMILKFVLLAFSFFIAQSVFASDGLPLEPKELGLCIEIPPGKRCFALEGQDWIQDLGAGFRATTPVDVKDRTRLETDITNFKSWSKSELAKRPKPKGEHVSCRATIAFSIKRKTESLCYDTLRGSKLDAKLEAVVKSLSFAKPTAK